MKVKCYQYCLLLAGLVLAPFDMSAGIGDIDAFGWTILTPSEDSRLVYVSSSDGDDGNDGLSPGSPKKTIDAANALIRDGYPDWLLLKRGDTFAQPNLGRWKSGRSVDEPMVMTYYGDSGPRPVILLTDELVSWAAQARNHLAFVGLDLYRSISDPDSPDFTNASCGTGLQLNAGMNNACNVLIEDCRFRYCWINPQGQNDTYFVHNVQIRRNIVLNSWIHGSLTSVNNRIQGMFVRGVVDILIEENLFHHNGWSEVIADANASQYNHNIYMSTSNDGVIIVRGNIISFGAAHGLQLRSGGYALMNAFVGNAVGMNIGYSSAPDHYTDETIVEDNVVTDGRPQIPNDNTEPQTGVIWGIWRQTLNNTPEVNTNIVANIANTQGFNMKPFNAMTANQFGTGNIAWNWVQNNVPSSDPGWTDPDRNADSFGDSLGLDDWEGFIEAASNRGIGEMPLGLTAYSYVNYIREGFDLEPVTPPYQFDGEDAEFTYLQLEITGTTNSSEGRIAEIDWLVGGASYPNPHFTGPSSYVTHTGNAGWEAYDGSTASGSFWKLFESTTGTITLELAGGAIAPTAIRIRPVTASRAPSGFIVRGSENGSTWVTLGTVSGLTASNWSAAGNDLTFNLSY